MKSLIPEFSVSDEPVPNVSVIIPAAGEGSRMGGGIRKPWIELDGEPILYRTCRVMKSMPGVNEIILSLHPEDAPHAQEEWWDDLSAVGVTLVVEGGATRAESVWNAVQVMGATSELVAIHDAVRPFVSREVCSLLFKTAADRGAAIPIVPLADTIKRTEGDSVTETPSRVSLVRVQTPQVFQSDIYIDACEYALRTGGFPESLTDDAMLVENFGQEVAVVLSEEYTFKITTPRDLRIAEALLTAGVVTGG